MGNPDHARLLRLDVPLALLLAGLLLAGCNYPGIKRQTDSTASFPEGELSLAEALAVAPEDRRPAILAAMGAPDAFSISFDTLEGQVVRSESWSYFDYGQRLDFIDGELLWTAELEPVPDGSLYAHWYTPESFSAQMSSAEARSLLAGQSLEAIDLAEGGAEGGLLLVGDQILLGFEQDRLVYVETLILSPDGSIANASLPSEPTPSQAGAATGAPAPRTNGALILQDDFESALPLAAGHPSDSFTIYPHDGGLARLEANLPFLPVDATYDLPTLQDFIAEFDLQAHELTQGAEAGLTFRSDAGASRIHYSALVIRPGENKIGLLVYQDQEFVVSEYKPVPHQLLSPDDAYHLRLEIQGGNVRLFLNGGFAAEFNADYNLEAGRIGLFLIAPQASQVVYFDNLHIYQLP